MMVEMVYFDQAGGGINGEGKRMDTDEEDSGW
jgi:hypothetical protein